MSYAEAIISGIVQGLTEFLPISSSGHLVILHHYFGYKEPKILFDIFLHVATLFAVLVYFRRDIINMIRDKHRLLVFVAVGSIPTAMVGYLCHDAFEFFFSQVKVIGAMLIVTAIFLIGGELVARKYSQSNKSLDWLKALSIGFMQGFSIMPGISRSGATISAGLFLGLKKEEAVRFSFFLSIPAIIGALLFKLGDGAAKVVITLPILAGGICAFLVGLLAIYLLIKAVLGNKLKYFAIYCILAGGAILIL
ncbi:MAG: undecaprenyl-diphosphate phosphatase [Candidatus Omnitrophica bacterium]|nr:undecaprenyl-diphosphate phosphatase [Candidatus Omnitrophota bacterium]